MRRSVPFRSAAGAFSAGILLLAGLSVLAWRNTARLVDSVHWTEHTAWVIAESRAVFAHLADNSLAQRGFILTGDEEFLKPRRVALDELPAHIQTLRTLLSDDPAQLRRLNTLDPLVRNTLDWSTRLISLRRKSGIDEATAAIRTKSGENLLTEIRTLLDLVEKEEQRLLGERTLALKASTTRVQRTLLAGYAVGAALLLGAFLAFGAEIRRRRRAEERRATSERQLQAILDNSPAAIHVKDLQGRFVLINREVARILGRSAEEVIGKTVRDFYPAEMADALQETDQKVIEGGSPLMMEEVRTQPDGLRTYLSTKFPLRDALGVTYALCGISTDITQRKQAEAELDRFFSLSLDMLCIANADGYFKRMSPAFTQTLGWSVEEMLARPFLDFVHPDDRDATLREVERQVVAGDMVLRFDNRYRHKDGSWRILSWNSVPQPDGMMYAVARDITERKEAEEQIEQLNAKLREHVSQLEVVNKELEAFSYSVSHDLRAPLRHIAGFAEMLRKHSASSLDEKGRHYLDVISKAVQRMGALIDDLLAFSRMGRGEMTRSTVRLGPLVEEVIRALREETPERRIEWAAGELPVVQGDPAMLRLVMVNLLSNAVKYSRGRDEARIEVGSREGLDGEIMVFVRDNGAGFDMGYAHKLFGVFQRLHSPEEFEGTGIGLANVRRIVHRHGGRVWAEGDIGRGATFYFSLPKQEDAVPCRS